MQNYREDHPNPQTPITNQSLVDVGIHTFSIENEVTPGKSVCKSKVTINGEVFDFTAKEVVEITTIESLRDFYFFMKGTSLLDFSHQEAYTQYKRSQTDPPRD